MLQVILGVIRGVSDFQQPCVSKRQVLEWNIHLNLYVIQFYVVIVCHLFKQSTTPYASCSKIYSFHLPHVRGKAPAKTDVDWFNLYWDIFFHSSTHTDIQSGAWHLRGGVGYGVVSAIALNCMYGLFNSRHEVPYMHLRFIKLYLQFTIVNL